MCDYGDAYLSNDKSIVTKEIEAACTDRYLPKRSSKSRKSRQTPTKRV